MRHIGVAGALALGLVGFVSIGRAQAAKAGGTAPSLTRFTVTFENVSTPTTLKHAKGGAESVPLSAVVWAVYSAANPMFTPGQIEPGMGLKGLAEAGMAVEFAANLGRSAGVRSHGACGAPPAPAAKTRGVASSVRAQDACRMLVAGDRTIITIDARPGDRLSLASMLGTSNDGLVATGPEGIPLFDASGRPASGDVTARLSLWDAGTEVNEEPGLGRNQGMTQGAPNAGDPERRPVRLMAEAEFGRAWPAVGKIVRVTLAPAKM